MPFSIAIFAASLGTLGAVPEPPCTGASNREQTACVEARFERADAELARYVAAARKLLAREARSGGPGTEAGPAFAAAEKAFAKYRQAECGAVGSYIGIGSGRAESEYRCLLRITRLHTHTVWAEWLTSDRLGSGLPEPGAPPRD